MLRLIVAFIIIWAFGTYLSTYFAKSFKKTKDYEVKRLNKVFDENKKDKKGEDEQYGN